MVAAHGSGDTGFNLIQHQITSLRGGYPQGFRTHRQVKGAEPIPRSTGVIIVQFMPRSPSSTGVFFCLKFELHVVVESLAAPLNGWPDPFPMLVEYRL